MNRREFLRVLGLGTAAVTVSALGLHLAPRRTVSTVPPGTGTLQRAILEASPGDMLVLQSGGTYHERKLTIPREKKGLSIQGNGAQVVLGKYVHVSADDFRLANTVFIYPRKPWTAIVSDAQGAVITGNIFRYA
jgi:hypothetical protein